MPITALPTPPSRQDPANFSSRADLFLGALPTFATEANALQAAVNNSEVNATAQASAANASATAAANSANAAASSATTLLASANYKGAWSTLSGALNKPASVTHSGKYWLLNTNVADVTTKTPGVASEWTELVVLQSRNIFGDNTGFRPVSEGEMVFKQVMTNSGASQHRIYKWGANFAALVLSGSMSTIRTSPDGETWTARSLPSTYTIDAVTNQGTDVIMATSGLGILKSTDSGVSWAHTGSALANASHALGFAGSTYFALQQLASATGTFQTSTNGTSWSNGGTNPLPFGHTPLLQAIAYNASTTTLIVGGTLNSSATTQAANSANGTSWTARTLNASVDLRALATNGSGTVVGVPFGSTSFQYSTNSGDSWSSVTVGSSNWLDVAYMGSSTTWVAVGSSGAILSSTAPGTTWTSRTSGTAQTLRCVGATTGQFVAAGDSGTLLTSPDGITWTARTSNTGQNIMGVASSGALWVAVGNGGAIVTSPDGITWTARTSGVTQNLSRVAYGNSRFVAVGANGTVLTSTDGINWTQQAELSAETLSSVVYGNGNWFIGGTNSLLMRSTDGTATAFTAILNTNSSNGINYVNKKRLGSMAIIQRKGSAFYWTSTDGTTWTPRSMPQRPVSSTMAQIQSDGSMRALASSLTTVMETSDGINWASSTCELPQWWPSQQPAPFKLNGAWLYPSYSNSTYETTQLFVSSSLTGPWGQYLTQSSRGAWYDAMTDEYQWEMDISGSPRAVLGGTNTHQAVLVLKGAQTGMFA